MGYISMELCYDRDFVFNLHSYDWKHPENHYRTQREEHGVEEDFTFELKEHLWIEFTLKPLLFEPYLKRRDELHPNFFANLWSSRGYKNGMEKHGMHRWRIDQERMVDYR